MSDITLHTIDGEHIEGEDLDLRCACGREEWDDECITMSGKDYVYILCPCDRFIRVEWDDKGYTQILIGAVGSASDYTKSRMGD